MKHKDIVLKILSKTTRFLSIEDVAKQSRLSLSQVRSAKRCLERDGYIFSRRLSRRESRVSCYKLKCKVKKVETKLQKNRKLLNEVFR